MLLLNTDHGNTYEAKGDYDSAIKNHIANHIASLVKPHDATTYTNRGVIYSCKGDYDRAIADYNEAIRIDSDCIDAYTKRGNAYKDKKDYDRAIADYNEALRIDPDNAEAKKLLAEAQQMRGK